MSQTTNRKKFSSGAHMELLAALGNGLFRTGEEALCESPIERLMALGLIAVGFERFGDLMSVEPGTNRGLKWFADNYPDTDARLVCEIGNMIAWSPWAAIASQCFVESANPNVIYRVDLAIGTARSRSDGHSRSTRVAIECDGHDFHERTKEQAAHDKSRDRYLTLSGWTVARFTGSEIWRDPLACARQAWEMIK